MAAARTTYIGKREVDAVLLARLVVVARCSGENVVVTDEIGILRATSPGLVCFVLEALEITRSQGSAKDGRVSCALLPLGYCIGSNILLLPFPQKVLLKALGELRV